MRLKRFPLVLAFVGVLAACSSEMSLRQQTEAEQAIAARLETYVRALNNSQLDTLLLMHNRVAQSTVILGGGTEANGWEEVEELYRSFFAGIDRMNMAMQRPQTEIFSTDLAITTLRHSTDVINEDGTRGAPVAGHMTILWKMDPRDGVWKIHLSHMSFKPPTVEE